MARQDIWYYAPNNQKRGPITLQQLRDYCVVGQLPPTMPVWTVGMPHWQPADQVPELADLFAARAATPARLATSSANLAGSASLPTAAIAPRRAVAMRTLAYSTQPEVMAGFWLRFGARFLDGLVLAIPGCLFNRTLNHLLNIQPPARPTPAEAFHYMLVTCGASLPWFVICGFYFVLMECSSKQATLGKMAVGIRVTDLDGGRIGVGRAIGRYAGKLLSEMILFVGYMMAGWTNKKQALHDMMAGTLVVRK